VDQQLKQLVEGYQPSPQTVAAMSHVKLAATVGPSASGKTTIMNALTALHSDVHHVIGETSRAPRHGEQAGEDMHFRDKAEIVEELKAGQLTQVVIGPNGDLYCTRPESFPPDKICVYPLIPHGVEQFRALPLKFFAAAFIVPAGYELWRQWLDKQARISGWSTEKLLGRLEEAKKSFSFALNDKDMHFVLNDEIDKAAERLYQIAQGQKPAEEDEARRTAMVNFDKLQNE